MSRLRARLDVAYPDFRLQVELELPTDGVIAVFGPSGCGKTTLLRCLAGLQRAPRGYVQLDGDVWQDDAVARFLPIHRRAVGYVFQDLRLFPHLSVRANLQYGWSRTPQAERRFELGRVADLLGLGPLLDRRPAQLSGGEQQRVAIGRAVLASPRLLLLDEPLSSLDWKRRQELLPFIVRLDRELRIPIVYVSHSLREILQLTKTLVLLNAGRVVAVGPINEVFSRLDLRPYLGQDGIGAVLDTVVAAHEPEFGLTQLEFLGRRLFVPSQPRAVGERVRVHILSKDVSLVAGPPPERTSILNVLEGTIEEIDVEAGDAASVEVKLNVGCPLLATITKKSVQALALRPGQKVYAQIKAIALTEDLEE